MIPCLLAGMCKACPAISLITTTYAFDPVGRRTGTTDLRTGTTVTHYDEHGRIDYIQDPAGNRTTYTYDPGTGQKLAETNTLGNITRYAYNTRGQVIRTLAREKNGEPLVIRYSYDPATGYLVSIDYPGDMPDIFFVYDRMGRMIQVMDAAGTRTFAYDADGNLTSWIENNKETQYI